MNKPVKDILGDLLPEFGFTAKKGRNWYRDKGEVLHVIGLQKSNWGTLHYLNLAIWVKQLGEEDRPRFEQCHIQQRLGSIALHPSELEAALNEEDYWKMDEGERARILKLEIANAEFVFYREMASVQSIRQYLLDGSRTQNLAVTRALKNALQIPL